MSIFNKISRLFRIAKGLYYRQWVILKAKKIGSGLKVLGPTKINRNTYLGDNVNFNGMEITGQGKVAIGNNFHSGPECLMITQMHNYKNAEAIPYDNKIIYKDITIEDNVWIGRRVIILGGVNIREGAIIQTGSCVVNDIPKYAIAGGHPARVFGQRDIEHYERMKQGKKFH